LLDFYEERINWLEPGREASNDVSERLSREVQPADSQHGLGHGANTQGKTYVIFIKLPY
jgi:hypothetical protein